MRFPNRTGLECLINSDIHYNRFIKSILTEKAMSNTDQHRSELANLFTGVSQTITDTRAYQTRNVHTVYTFPGYTKAEWMRKRRNFENIFWSATG